METPLSRQVLRWKNRKHVHATAQLLKFAGLFVRQTQPGKLPEVATIEYRCTVTFDRMSIGQGPGFLILTHFPKQIKGLEREAKAMQGKARRARHAQLASNRPAPERLELEKHLIGLLLDLSLPDLGLVYRIDRGKLHTSELRSAPKRCALAYLQAVQCSKD